MAEPAQIETITTPFFPGISVNCTLIDTARHGAGSAPGKLRLILLTHGDFDHCGNAAHLRRKYQTRVAMHLDDRGKEFWEKQRGDPP